MQTIAAQNTSTSQAKGLQSVSLPNSIMRRGEEPGLSPELLLSADKTYARRKWIWLFPLLNVHVIRLLDHFPNPFIVDTHFPIIMEATIAKMTEENPREWKYHEYVLVEVPELASHSYVRFEHGFTRATYTQANQSKVVTGAI